MEMLQIVLFTALVCVAVVLLRPRQPAFGFALALAACCAVLLRLLTLVAPVMDWMRLAAQTLDGESFGVLLRCTGVALIAQVAQALCKDSGQEALGTTVELAGRVMVLLTALPLLRTVLTDILRMMQ